MTQKKLEMTRILDRPLLDRMHAAALDILARTGLRLEHQPIRAEIAKRKGFTSEGDRMLVAPELVSGWLDERRERHAAEEGAARPDKPADLTYAVSDRNTWIVDRDGTTLRPMMREDVIAGTKMMHVSASRGVRGSTPGLPCDVPMPLRPIEQFMIGAEYSAQGGATPHICDIATAEIIRDMNRVYGRPFHQTVHCPSPLVFGGSEAEIFWRFREEIVLAAVGTMPMMGVNGPCDPIGVFTLSIAECLGTAAILRALKPELDIIIAPHPEPADMRTGAMVFGTPEWQLLDLMHRDVYEYYGRTYNVKLLLTSASLPNAQAQIERATSAVLGMLGGYTHFEPLGQIGIDEVWSPAQLILDLEMIAEAARIAQGVWSAPGLELDALPAVVDEVVRGGLLFAEHESTLADFRRQYRQPEVLQRIVRPQWETAARPDVLREAYQKADKLVAAYQHEPPQDILRELRTIYERGRERLSNPQAGRH
jgi:trimethylamine:corrinoid methyltransferase-like protein